MGFDAKHLRQNCGTGNYIYSALGLFCGSSTSPLRQLSEKLGCLTKRTPKTLGDIFGFIWHLNGQLFNKTQTLEKLKEATTRNFNSVEHCIAQLIQSLTQVTPQSSPEESAIVKSLESKVPSIPFLYQLFMAKDPKTLPGALFDLTQHCHKWNSNQYKHESANPTSSIHDHSCTESPSDLWSLYYPVYSDTQHTACRNAKCGGYLEPLTLSYGATFSPSAAPAYLSWAAYLTDDLYGQLSEMLHDFNNVNCTQCNPNCSCRKGQHGKSTCYCTSVVSCAGVLPHLYSSGFSFHNAFWLRGRHHTGGQWQENPNKRTCVNFHSQFQSVISGKPHRDLFESIDTFLFLFRYYFLCNISGFWSIYVCLILYTFFFLLDTLHMRSHLKLTSSDTVPPLALLTSGTPLPITKLTYIGQ